MVPKVTKYLFCICKLICYHGLLKSNNLVALKRYSLMDGI